MCGTSKYCQPGKDRFQVACSFILLPHYSLIRTSKAEWSYIQRGKMETITIFFSIQKTDSVNRQKNHRQSHKKLIKKAFWIHFWGDLYKNQQNYGYLSHHFYHIVTIKTLKWRYCQMKQKIFFWLQMFFLWNIWRTSAGYVKLAFDMLTSFDNSLGVLGVCSQGLWFKLKILIHCIQSDANQRQ